MKHRTIEQEMGGALPEKSEGRRGGRCCKCCLVGVALMGVVTLVGAACFNTMYMAMARSKMEQMLAIAPDSYSYANWKTPPLPVLFELYVFNITNPQEVLKGKPPVVVEKGPYTYRASLEKFNITFHDNGTVSFRERQTYVYDRTLSIGWDNETFTTISAPLFTIGVMMQSQPSYVRTAMNVLLNTISENAFPVVSVHDIFWGYPDPWMVLAKRVCDTFHIHNPLFTGEFGFFMGKNKTDEGLMTVNTGANGLDDYLKVTHWNGQTALDVWNTEQANMINGTDGSQYPPFVTEDRIGYYFDPNIFRSLEMRYKERVQVKGVETMKFTIGENIFANASVEPANAGFCTPKCMPSGMQNSSAMGHGAPIYVSMPHFLGADPYYFNLVKGLRPDPAKHQPFFSLHPFTGVCLSAGRRYQLNVQMKSYDFLDKTKGLPLAYVPVLWINGVADISDDTASTFRNGIDLPMLIIHYVHYGLYGMGGLMLLIPLIVMLCRRKPGQKKMFGDGYGTENYGKVYVDEISPLLANEDESDRYYIPSAY